MYSGKIGCTFTKWFPSSKVFVFGQSGCIRAKVVVFGHSGCIRAKVLVIGKMAVFEKKWFASGKVVVNGLNCLYPGKIGCIPAKWL